MISSITDNDDFSQTNTCGASLAASASCTLSASFTPTAGGWRSGSLTISDNATPATQTITLTGTGAAPLVSLSPTSLTFAPQLVGAGSGAQSVTLSNTGNAGLSISSITVSGDFSQINTCGFEPRGQRHLRPERDIHAHRHGLSAAARSPSAITPALPPRPSPSPAPALRPW